MSSAASLGDALETLGLRDPGSKFSVVDEGDWRVGGSETYVLDFGVATSRGVERYLLKAVIAFRGGGVGHTAAEWLSRRDRLACEGVTVPRFYALNRATFLEEYVPLSLGEAIHCAGPAVSEIRAGCVKAARAVARLGFRPTSLFFDARSHGRDVVLVDFGEDLGPVHAGRDPSWAERALGQFFDQLGWSLTEIERQSVRS